MSSLQGAMLTALAPTWAHRRRLYSEGRLPEQNTEENHLKIYLLKIHFNPKNYFIR